MLTIKNFRKNVRPVVLQRAKEYLDNDRIISVRPLGEDTYRATVEGSEKYEVSIRLKGGYISETLCSCPYDHDGLCKHITAVLMFLEKNMTANKPLEVSSDEVRTLISKNKRLKSEAFDNTALSEKVRLQPLLSYDLYRSALNVSLKIGCQKMYKVRDIGRLYQNFQTETFAEYGKNLAFTHSIDKLDERSRELLKMIGPAYVSTDYYYRNSNAAVISGMYLDSFFELYRDDNVLFDDKPFLVKFENPVITFVLKRCSDNRFSLERKSELTAAGKGVRSCFIDHRRSKILIAGVKFTRAVYDLYKTVQYKGTVYIFGSDMPEFYSEVLKRAAEYVKIEGLELVREYIPPEMTAQLYVDCSDDNTVYADLMFCYNNDSYNAFSGKNAPHYDEAGESAAKAAVLRYFTVCAKRDHRSLLIAEDAIAFRFITEGISELSKTMELYVSDKFRRMAVRPPIAPKIGVSVSGRLLELDISDDNYSLEELSDILKAYRAGAKYSRLKDGSYALIDDMAARFAELVDNLDLSDKKMLKKNPKVPAFRMMYLDSLKNRGSVRMKYSAEFKKAVTDYHKSVSEEGAFVPKELENIMRDYQKYGFRWMKTISAYKFGGILADDMGLGKTVQAISLILDMQRHKKKHLPALIVCPSSLTLNWEAEIARFAPNLKVLTVIGTAAVRKRLIEKIPTGKYDAVITSYAMITRDIDSYSKLKFSLHFIDEAQFIKNHNTQAAKAVKAIASDTRFALTGTPIENNLAELWSAFDFIMPGYLFNYARFRKTFERPIAAENDSAALNELQSSVAPFILRRMKKDVLSELPDKTETVLRTTMEGEQRKLYAANVSELQKSIKGGLGEKKTDRVKILSELTKLREICCEPSLIYENFKSKSAKLEQCAELVESCVNSGHKILLFSQFTSMLDIISKRLDDMNISYYMLKGSTPPKERIRLVNEFNENDVKVFLISLKAGGTGLNITGADIVIHYDPWWNVSAENQASDRAYRIGQKKNVQIYKLIVQNSIEENIIRLQQSKSELSELIYGKAADITKMSANEILELLE